MLAAPNLPPSDPSFLPFLPSWLPPSVCAWLRRIGGSQTAPPLYRAVPGAALRLAPPSLSLYSAAADSGTLVALWVCTLAQSESHRAALPNRLLLSLSLHACRPCLLTSREVCSSKPWAVGAVRCPASSMQHNYSWRPSLALRLLLPLPQRADPCSQPPLQRPFLPPSPCARRVSKVACCPPSAKGSELLSPQGVGERWLLSPAALSLALCRAGGFPQQRLLCLPPLWVFLWLLEMQNALLCCLLGLGKLFV